MAAFDGRDPRVEAAASFEASDSQAFLLSQKTSVGKPSEYLVITSSTCACAHWDVRRYN